MPDYYGAILDVLGATGTIIPIGQSPINWNGQAIGENSALTTLVTAKGASGLTATFTYSIARNLWTNTRYKGRARVPVLRANDGPYLSAPDDAYLSSIEPAAFSIGLWIQHYTPNPVKTMFAKWGAGVQEWKLYYDLTARRFTLALYDQSAAVQVQKAADIDFSFNGLTFMVATYDGSGGATAANGITLYQNGEAVAGTATNNASYVAMENLTSVVYLYREGAGGTLIGSIAGGPIGPFIAKVALTADQVRRLYLIGVEAQENVGSVLRRLQGR